MPSDQSGWRSTAEYDYVEDLSASDLAWEWLRRNKRYSKDYATLSKAATDNASTETAFLKKWRLRFRSRSDANSTKGPHLLGSWDRPGSDRFAASARSTGGRESVDPSAQDDHHFRPRRPPSSH